MHKCLRFLSQASAPPPTWMKSSEFSIRKQQIVEHLASPQGETEQGLTALRTTAAQSVPLPDPRMQAAKLLTKMTPHDDVEAFLRMFETTATSEVWHPDDWARALAPLLTGEAQQAYFALPAASANQYAEVKKEILARLGLSSICAAQYFYEWEYKTRLPVRAQAAELTRLAQHWLLEGAPSASQVAERVVIDRLLRALPRSHRQVVGMRNLGACGSHRAGGCSPTSGCWGASAAISPEGGSGATRAGGHPATNEQAGGSLSAG